MSISEMIAKMQTFEDKMEIIRQAIAVVKARGYKEDTGKVPYELFDCIGWFRFGDSEAHRTEFSDLNLTHEEFCRMLEEGVGKTKRNVNDSDPVFAVELLIALELRSK